jgi:hypothetical protein
MLRTRTRHWRGLGAASEYKYSRWEAREERKYDKVDSMEAAAERRRLMKENKGDVHAQGYRNDLPQQEWEK